MRKCIKVPLSQEDLEAAVPLSDSHGRASVNADDTVPIEQPASGEDENIGESRYLIERILRAEPQGRGWVVYVKWRDYDDVTTEPVSSIVRDTRGDPDILRQIQDAQGRYRDEHPVRVPADGRDLPVLDAHGEQAPVPDSTADPRPAPTVLGLCLPAALARPSSIWSMWSAPRIATSPTCMPCARVPARTLLRIPGIRAGGGDVCSCRGAVGPDLPARAH